MKRSIYISILVLSTAALFTACSKNKLRREPGTIYAPDMTYSQAYETYSENPNYANGTSARERVEGTVARGSMAYPVFEAGDSAKVFALSNPLEMTQNHIDEGKRLFNIYCGICHGTALDGNGPLYASGKYPLAPTNLKGDAVKAFSQGKLYYTILFGKNMMGSYASQLTEEQRWLVVGYIHSVNSGKAPAAESADTEESPEDMTADAAENTEAPSE